MRIDISILGGCENNDRRAQLQLYKSCFSILLSVCLRYKHNREDAVSVLNMGFFKIITNIDKYNDSVPFEAWIRRIMINTIIDEFRKEKKQMEIIEYTDFQENDYQDSYIDINDVDKKYSADELQEVLMQLPPLSKKVFNLYAIDGYSHKEVSDMLGMSVGTSKWHVSNARKELEILLKKRFKLKIKIG